MPRALAIFLGFVFAARAVSASPEYPDVIRLTVPTEQPLPCTLCHTDTDGGDGTVSTLFARELMEFGMKGGDPNSLHTALRRDAAEAWDSDGDGIPDIEELIYGSDPSSPALSNGPPLMHGCAVNDGVPRASGSLFAAVFLACACGLWRKRRQ